MEMIRSPVPVKLDDISLSLVIRGARHNLPLTTPNATAELEAYTIAAEHIPPVKTAKIAIKR
jgi:hypothetical protein